MTILVSFLIVVVLPPPAYGHAALSPRTSAPGKVEVYQVIIFAETSAPTILVELLVPEGMDVQNVEPTVGWLHNLVRNSSGSVSKIVWNGTLRIGGQVELRFVAKNADKEGEYAFKVLQKYANGEVAEWDYAGMRVRLEPRAEIPIVGYLLIVVVIVTVTFGFVILRKRLKRTVD